MKFTKRMVKHQWMEQVCDALRLSGKTTYQEKDGRRVCVYKCEVCGRNRKVRVSNVDLPDAPGICKYCIKHKRDKVLEWLDANQN